ncbi:MAG TPA: beta-propeller fold lactonase family protein [Terriglobales bacterium]|nr:beta-propeller fold lactonase family protein [Terriglobales bacterium]
MRVALLWCLLTVLLCEMTGCGSRQIPPTPSTEISSATIYSAVLGNPGAIQSYTATLSLGSLNQFGASPNTGNAPFSIAITPSLNALFVSNNGSNTISAYSLNSGGSLTAVAGSTPTGAMPTGMATDPAGRFLFVANEASSTISVYTINGTALQPVAGSPFTTITPGAVEPTLPTAVAVSATGNFLYVANTFTNTVGAYSISSSGTLSILGASPYPVGTAPSGLGITPGGGFLYVANSGTSNVSAFAICDKVVTTCANPNIPDGTLTTVKGSPFAAGLGPIEVAADPYFPFLYVLNKQSNQISEYGYAAGTGVLTPLSTPSVSTGQNPLSFVIIAGATGSNAGFTTTEPKDYVYVANSGASTLAAFTLNTTTGVLTPLGVATDIAGQPSAVASP